MPNKTNFVAILVILLSLTGCGEDGPLDFSGDDTTIYAPSSITGYKLVQRVTSNSGASNLAKVGTSITYQFISTTKILGAGESTGNVLPTTSWSYRTNSNVATVELFYGDIGSSEEELTFTSYTKGTFVSYPDLYSTSSSNDGWIKGTFTIEKISTTSTDTTTDTTETTTVDTCNDTGKITVYTTSSAAIEKVTVELDDIVSGSFTTYLTSGKPTCGSSDTTSSFTKTLDVGTHYIKAYDKGGNSWSTDSFSVTDCSCLLYELY